MQVLGAKTAISAKGQTTSLLDSFTLDNITMTVATAGGISYATGWSIKNLNITAEDQEPIAV